MKWRNMSDQQKEVYRAMAAEEQGLRDEAILQTLKPKSAKSCDPPLGDAAFDAAGSLCRNALKKISLHRLINTYEKYKQDSGWQHFDAGLATSEGAMALDDIDLDTSQESVASTWAKFVGPPTVKPEWVNDVNPDIAVHHKVCGSGVGLCKQSCFLSHAQKFARSLQRYITSGTFS